jgi:peptide/nickel transport system permease protein
VLSPVGAILVTVMGFNMFGDGLRDAIDPYQN